MRRIITALAATTAALALTGCHLIRWGDPVPNLGPGDELWFYDITREQCDHAGGIFHANGDGSPYGLCERADF